MCYTQTRKHLEHYGFFQISLKKMIREDKASLIVISSLHPSIKSALVGEFENRAIAYRI